MKTVVITSSAKWLDGWFMVFYASFNNISFISWRSVLLVEETRVHGEKITDLSQVTDKLYFSKMSFKVFVL